MRNGSRWAKHVVRMKENDMQVNRSRYANALLRIASRRFFDSDSFFANEMESNGERGDDAVWRLIRDAGGCEWLGDIA